MYKAALTVETQKVLDKIQSLDVLRDFYLAGGTALALQLGHRKSIDLDFFTPNQLSNDLLTQSLIPFKPTITQQDKMTLNTLIDNVKVSFLNYPYPLLEKTVRFQNIELASVLDIACMKLIAVAQRGTKKDFVDLYTILNTYKLGEILQACEKKYQGVNYQRLHILKSLVYFDDANNDPNPDYLIPTNWNNIKGVLGRSCKHSGQ
ncbi:MAG: nucleotidyl transferase AbiEii/AbiGii toxin family protein [bacterium]